MNHPDSAFTLSFIARYFTWKRVFYFLAFLGLILLPLLSLDAGISGDEEVHFRQSQKVLDYYTTFGKDTSALDTPHSHLKYYGQSFDNFTTLLIQIFKIDTIYTFRHVSNSLVGWFAILIAGLLGIWISGYRTGSFILIFFYLSPRFIGHAFNNLKDIPFAFAYIMALYFMFRVIEGLPKPRFRYILLLILSIGLTISIRIGGVILIFYLLVFTGLFLLSHFLGERKLVTAGVISRSVLVVLLISIGGYLMGLIFWPYALENPIKNPVAASGIMASFPTTLRQIFEGEYIWSDHMPWYYLLKYMLITVPTLIWVGLILFLVFVKKVMSSNRWLFILFLLASFAFPVFYVIFSDANLYGAWRHLLFVYPPLLILSGIGYNYLVQRYSSKAVVILTTLVILILAIHPVRFIIRNHPYQYLYFNELAGGLKGAYGEYETDYYFHSMREASGWLGDYIKEENKIKNPVVASNFPITWDLQNKDLFGDFKFIKYYERGNVDWDYAIIGNSYIHPYQLRESVWPPDNTIHTVDAEGVPVCAILERTSKDDFSGSVLLKEDKTSQAIQHLKRALAFDPSNESALMNLTMAYFKEGKMDSAHHILDEVARIYPDYDVALDMRAMVFLEDDEIDSAKMILTSILEVNPKYYLACYRLANIYLEEQNDKLGIYYLKRCLRLNPKYNPALLKMGEYYKKRGKMELSEKYFSRIVTD